MKETENLMLLLLKFSVKCSWGSCVKKKILILDFSLLMRNYGFWEDGGGCVSVSLMIGVTARFFVILFLIILCMLIYACIWIFILGCCHTLILDLKILIQIPLLFSNTFKSTVFAIMLQLHTLLLQSFKSLHKIIQKGILVISYKGTHFQSLQFVPESFQSVCMDHLSNFVQKSS